MITVFDLHLRLDTAYSNLNSNRRLDVLPEIKDIILNNAVNEFINSVLTPIKNPERLGFESTEVIYSKLQRLVSDKKQPICIGNPVTSNDSSYFMFDNELISDTNISAYSKVPYCGYAFKPHNQLDIIKAMLEYSGSNCEQETFNTVTKPQYYTIVPMSDFVSDRYLVCTVGATTYPLIAKTCPFLTTYSTEYKSIIINQILNLYKNPYQYGSPFRFEIGYEMLDGVYASDSLIIKDNALNYFTADALATVTMLKISDDSVVKNYTQNVYNFKQLNGSTSNYTKTALYSNKTFIDINDNYYYQKNKIEEVPISFRNNMYIIGNLLPKYIPKNLIVTYIRKPIVIDTHLQQGLELIEDVDTIIAIAARLMTAYTSNPTAYQISNNELNKI